jgi:serralysin
VLRAGQEIEVLETTNQLSDAALDLIGNEFGNTIIGNEGNNTIAGSPVDDGAGYDGLDIMIGNGGADRFVWTSLAESGTAASEADVVQDFTPGEDLIVISPIDADPGDADNDAFSFVGVVDFTRSEFTAPGQIGYLTTATDTYILLNTDGDRFEEMTIRIYGVHTVDASWFEL